MHGLYLLWWVGERGVSPAIVATILAAGDLALIALEVPAGWFADRFGHRTSLIVGSAVQILAMVACWLGQGVPELILAAVLVALGDAFRSGADEALLYRTCAALHREDDFQRIEARTRATGLIALVVLLLAGGLIVSVGGFAAAWATETALCMAGFVIACAMVEPENGTSNSAGPSSNEHRADVFVETSANNRRRVALLIVPVAVLGGIAAAMSFLVQTVELLRPEVVTVVVAAITLAEAAGAAFAGRVIRSGIHELWLLAATGAGVAWGVAGLPFGLLVSAVASSFFLGFVHPLRATLLQRSSADDARARVASLANACDVAASAIAVSLAGGLARRHPRQ